MATCGRRDNTNDATMRRAHCRCSRVGRPLSTEGEDDGKVQRTRREELCRFSLTCGVSAILAPGPPLWIYLDDERGLHTSPALLRFFEDVLPLVARLRIGCRTIMTMTMPVLPSQQHVVGPDVLVIIPPCAPTPRNGCACYRWIDFARRRWTPAFNQACCCPPRPRHADPTLAYYMPQRLFFRHRIRRTIIACCT
jgi:hypothetical protein